MNTSPASLRPRFSSALLSTIFITALGGCPAADDDVAAADTGTTTGDGATGVDVSTGPDPQSTRTADTSTAADDTAGGTIAAGETTAGDATAGTDTLTDTDGSESSGTTGTGIQGQVVMETSLGTLVIELYPEESPITVANFLAYIDAGFYDGTDGLSATVMHRVLPGFVIQGGGLTAALAPKATMPPIVNEHGNGLTNLRGTLSMARTAMPDTATSQFFINVVDNPGLDTPPGYAVFGAVVEGLDIVDAIVAVPTATMGPYDDVPVQPIVITSVTVL